MADWEVASQTPVPSVSDKAAFSELLDKTFGKGKWRITGGIRSNEREDELRAEGAQTVKPGETSRHTLGTADAPGAYDVVVDGLNPRQVARKLSETGADFLHFYPEGTRATQGAHLHVAVPVGEGKPHVADDQWQVASEAPVPAKKAAPAKAKPSFLGQVAESFADVPREMEKQSTAALGHLKAEVGSLGKRSSGKTFEDAMHDTGASAALAGLDYLASPIEGALTSIVGRPVETTTGIPRRTAADVAQLAVPFAGEAGAALKAGKLAEEAGVGTNYARKVLTDRKALAAVPPPKATSTRPTLAQTIASVGPTHAAQVLAERPDPAYVARVERLEKEGIALSPGMKLGGKAKIIEDASTSNPYRGQAVVDARNHAIETLNQAVYNKALAPLGETVPPSMRAGRQGVGYVAQKLGAAYDKLLPTIKVGMDDDTITRLAEIEKASDKLGAPQAQQFKAIVDQDVLHHMPIGSVSDGRTFKSVQSDLLRQSRAFKGSQDPNQRAMGHMLDDVLDTLTSSAERHSPAGTREELRKVNTGYAIFTRIQDAATRRIATAPGAEPGVFTPTDLVAAVKKGDRSVRKGAFARGDALLQQFAEDAEAVLPSKVGDSGTATRLNVTRPGPIGAGIGGVVGGVPGAVIGAGAEMGARAGTNALASHLLSAPRTPMVRNYLLAAKRRLDAHQAAKLGVAAAGAADLSDPK